MPRSKQQYSQHISNSTVKLRGQTINELMRETEEVATKRRALREMQDLLHRANEIVNEVSITVNFFNAILVTPSTHLMKQVRSFQPAT
jgi:hypothetical protein